MVGDGLEGVAEGIDCGRRLWLGLGRWFRLAEIVAVVRLVADELGAVEF